MSPHARLAIVAVVVATGTVVGVVVSGRGGAPRPRTPFPSECLTPPPSIARPEWFPKDLPLPEGTVPVIEDSSFPQVRRILLTAPVDLDGFVAFVRDRWPAAGWELGRGEREPGEAEATFVKSEDRFGKFRARSVYCDRGATEVLLELVLEGRSLPTPGAS